MLIKDRVAIVTGGAIGIGRGIALKFAEEGCSIAIADILENEAGETLKEILKKGSDALFVPCDVTKSQQVKDMVKQVIGKFGKVDILVNNAGGLPSSMSIVDLPEERWDQVINLNLKGVFLFCKAVVPYMKEKGYGKIINISSLGAIRSPRPSIAYNSAKAGVLGLTYDLASELAPFRICVNAIMPGAIRTAFWDASIPSGTDKDTFFENLAQRMPMRRVGTPEDIAKTALYLASDLSEYVSGESVLVTGALHVS